jgi:peptidyl-prolyl cis-trans isomerase D
MEDKIEIKTIFAPKISVSDDEVKKFWEQHKGEYKSKLSYNIGYFYVTLDGEVTEEELLNFYNEHKLDKYSDNNGKILSFETVKEKVKKDLLAKKRKKDAILTMKKLKKGELQFIKVENVELQNKYLPEHLMEKLVKNRFLKPVLTEKGWLIAKLFKENTPQILSFDEAKEMAKQGLIIKKKKESLIKLAKSQLESFKGDKLGFVGREDINKLKKLQTDEGATLLETIYNSEKRAGYLLLPVNNPNKVVLFKITEQKLLNPSKSEKFKDNIINSANQMKQQLLEKMLIEKLTKMYQAQIKIYMKI